ncbi:MAG: hypothetical protein EA425_08320 [Puniceicoccaceae bacterium]|nr:MAG: hypothetical protein EA425_08320 [Puniceicoccaceae bacterium]
MPLPFDPKALFDLADRLGIIQSVKDKLVRQPEAAADKLVVVLGELSKIYGVCEAELVRFLNLCFAENVNCSEEREVLLSLEGGRIWQRAQEARGHCHKIWALYENYLDKWFHRVLSRDEAAELRALFERLVYADAQMDQALSQLTGWLSAEAERVLDRVDENDYAEANRIILQARKEILPTRRAINRALSGMLELQAEFISVSSINGAAPERD